MPVWSRSCLTRTSTPAYAFLHGLAPRRGCMSFVLRAVPSAESLTGLAGHRLPVLPSRRPGQLHSFCDV